MLKLIIRFLSPKSSGDGDWKVKQEFRTQDIVEANNDAISIRRVDGSVTTHNLRDRDWVIKPE